MGGIKDLTGQTFGDLTAIEKTDKRDKNGSVVWRCRCVCGKIVEKSISYLQCPLFRQSCGHSRQVGRRFGRLVTVRPLATKKWGRREWIMRCDCGNLTIKPILGVSNFIKSCGCISRGQSVTARCPACRKYFPIDLDGTPTPQFCPGCAPKYDGRGWRVCPICGKLYSAPPSSTATTCSKACYSAWRSRIQTNYHNTWSDEAKARQSAKGQTKNLKLGAEALKNSPKTGRFETNHSAKIWILVSPTGEEIVVRNLTLWARENTDLFGKPPGDKSAEQIQKGFSTIAQTLQGYRGAPGRPRGAMTYFGWSLKEPPRIPEKSEKQDNAE